MTASQACFWRIERVGRLSQLAVEKLGKPLRTGARCQARRFKSACNGRLRCRDFKQCDAGGDHGESELDQIDPP
jgi:hypothetical protein